MPQLPHSFLQTSLHAVNLYNLILHAFAANLLKTKADLMNIPLLKLKIDVATLWNSAYDMIGRYLEVQVAVLTVLPSKELAKMRRRDDLDTLSDADISL